tara:strand:- start:3420 stop:3785 length:366 start_codon:yes stop_codon:yes gene_type:complete
MSKSETKGDSQQILPSDVDITNSTRLNEAVSSLPPGVRKQLADKDTISAFEFLAMKHNKVVKSYKRIRSILTLLVHLKGVKDKIVETADESVEYNEYREMKDFAWEEGAESLKNTVDPSCL